MYWFTHEPRTQYRILAAQFMMQNKRITYTQLQSVEAICIGFARDNHLDYSLRADVSDLLVRLGTNYASGVGREIITLLGRHRQGQKLSLYDNRQNVHDESIDKSVETYILHLACIERKYE